MDSWGGMEPVLGTDPISVALPAGKYPDCIIDMGTNIQRALTERIEISHVVMEKLETLGAERNIVT